MAPSRVTWSCLGLVLALLVLLTGCGIKSPPIPSSQVAPVAASHLEARTLAQGVEVSFTVPAASESDRQVTTAYLYYAYLPLAGDPACPPCPPKLHQYLELDLTKKLEKGEGGRFSYIDYHAPMGQQAVYQVILEDHRGRHSQPSGLIRAARTELPAAPQGLTATQGDAQVDLSWQPVTTLASGAPTEDITGYVLYRKGPDGEGPLNQRPMSHPGLSDKSIKLGQTYEYQVAAVRSVGNQLVVGNPGPWVSASAQSLAAPSTPGGLVGASLEDGIYLRFNPSPESSTAGYIVERAPAKGGPWRKLGSQLNKDNTYVDRDVKLGSVYYYRVTAVSDAGVASQPSQVLEIKHQP